MLGARVDQHLGRGCWVVQHARVREMVPVDASRGEVLRSAQHDEPTARRVGVENGENSAAVARNGGAFAAVSTSSVVSIGGGKGDL